MAFIREKTINGNVYLYEQESIRKDGKVASNHVRYIGKKNGESLGTTNINVSSEKANLKPQKISGIASHDFDLKNLVKLGSGRDRIVYDLNDGRVLKVAKNPLGLAQNESEGDYIALVPELYKNGKDYVITEKVDRDDKKSAEMLSPLKKFSQINFDMKSSELQTAFSDIDKKYGGFSDFMNYDLAYMDFTAKRNWGWKNNKPYLIDAGTLNSDSLNKKYLDNNPYLKKDWDKIKRLK